MVKIPSNFISRDNTNKCICNEIEDMNHIYECKHLNKKSPDIEFEYIFHGNISEQKKVLRRLLLLYLLILKLKTWLGQFYEYCTWKKCFWLKNHSQVEGTQVEKTAGREARGPVSTHLLCTQIVKNVVQL